MVTFEIYSPRSSPAYVTHGWFDSFPFHLCTDTHLKCRSGVLNWRGYRGRPRQSAPDAARRYAPDVIWRHLAHSSSPPRPRSVNCCALRSEDARGPIVAAVEIWLLTVGPA